MYLYKFSVKNAEDIDVNRIIREDKEDGGNHEVLLITACRNYAILLVSPVFLKNFRRHNSHWRGPALGVEFLWAGWGYFVGDGTSGWRSRTIKISDIPEIVHQLKAIRAVMVPHAAERKITVKVHSL